MRFSLVAMLLSLLVVNASMAATYTYTTTAAEDVAIAANAARDGVTQSQAFQQLVLSAIAVTNASVTKVNRDTASEAIKTCFANGKDLSTSTAKSTGVISVTCP